MKSSCPETKRGNAQTLKFCFSKYFLTPELRRYFNFQQFFCLQLQLVETVGIFEHSASRVGIQRIGICLENDGHVFVDEICYCLSFYS